MSQGEESARPSSLTCDAAQERVTRATTTHDDDYEAMRQQLNGDEMFKKSMHLLYLHCYRPCSWRFVTKDRISLADDAYYGAARRTPTTTACTRSEHFGVRR